MSSKKAKLVVRATYGVMQQNDRGICFRWLGDNNTHKDATLGHSYSLALEDLFSRNKGRIEQNKETRLKENGYTKKTNLQGKTLMSLNFNP